MTMSVRVSLLTDDNISPVNSIMKMDRQLKDISQELGISYDMFMGHVGRMLDGMMKDKRMVICNGMPKRMEVSWIAMKRKSRQNRRSKAWCRNIRVNLRQKNSFQCPSIRILMLTAFRDRHGPLLLDFLPQGETIYANSYFSTLSRLQSGG
ncbi:hypothetical protein TNIN_128161 [Trichonephila inaurata madagascariensis]|uniref:Uncharacterized protein n=1 Tax=Trichonephila inaurata madagascariensis TaxID=2747483 RepID=A0A8X7CDT9_9ARAC|nr:hypothetical protein TNIN_128161 [Trichonephila inaurata madagascariensis]